MKRPKETVRKTTGIRRDDGQSLVEFAFALPFLCLIVLALVDFGRAVNIWLNSSHVASQGARIAAVWGGSGTCAQLASKIKGYSYSGGTVTVSFPGGANIGDPIKITVTHPYSYAPTGFIPGTWNITGSAAMRLEQKPSFTGSCSA